MSPAFTTFLFILLIIPNSWKEIGERNKALREAERAFKTADFENSVRQHLALSTEFGMDDPALRFNLALSYQNNGQEEEAGKNYETLIRSRDSKIASFAANQSGVLAGNDREYKQALNYFKTSLIRNPDNEVARYNYELLSRWLEENEDEQEQDESEDQDKMEPSNYAKRMKAQADAMVDQFRFEQALDIMNRALEIDETVAYYEGFINHLNDVKEINQQQ
ncbi:hypothetical protein [Pleomorphovibrio marinus]|uniref:hypothetical protein n=1 Tax=Pleomorphovibrio marinus TaxID=2164132 RepID=UPI000E0AA392|nr:hypothetical protein [Pleomorphovibrio marinus]